MLTEFDSFEARVSFEAPVFRVDGQPRHGGVITPQEALELIQLAQLVGGIGGYEFLESDANHILPPGQRIVITSDLAAFTAAYPEVSASRIAGRPYAGRRNNGGETITLSDPAGGVIQRFRYDDRTSEGWYDETDGGGFSLVATGKPPPNWRQGPSESPRAAASEPNAQLGNTFRLTGNRPQPICTTNIVTL